jgi:hypothetical protein
VTSNPTILEKAISGGADYDTAIRHHVTSGVHHAEDLVFALALEDLVAAADLLRPVYKATRGTDRYVSVEVSPELAHDTEGTISAGRTLFTEADRPNFLIKMPGTQAGFVAVEELIASGVPVEPTLLAFAEHGVVCDLLQPDEAAADAILAQVSRTGVDIDDLADELQAKGAEVFSASWSALLTCIDTKERGVSGPQISGGGPAPDHDEQLLRRHRLPRCCVQQSGRLRCRRSRRQVRRLGQPLDALPAQHRIVLARGDPGHGGTHPCHRVGERHPHSGGRDQCLGRHTPGEGAVPADLALSPQ